MKFLRSLWILLFFAFGGAPAFATMPTFLAAGSIVSASSGTSITPTIPLQATTADVLVAVVDVANNATVSTPSGWILLGATNSGASFRVTVYVRLYAAGNPTFTWTGSAKNSAQIFAYRGVDFNNANNGAFATGSTSTVTSSATTTTKNETLAVLVYAATAATGLTAPTGWTQDANNTGSVTAITMASKPIPASGTSTGATSSSGASAAWATVQLILPASIPTPNALVFNNACWVNGKVGGTNAFDEEDDFAVTRLNIQATPRYRNCANILQVQVQPGDNLGFSGERAEVAFADLNGGFKDNVYYATGTRYYAFSMLLPVGWQSPTPDPTAGGIWGIPFQLHTPAPYGDVSPPIAMYATNHYSIYLNTGNIDVLGPYHATEYPFSDGGVINPGVWEDWVIGINFQQTTNGWIQVWRRTQGQTYFKQVLNQAGVATMAYQPTIDGGTAYPEYWRVGYYRSATPTFTSTLYNSGLAYGSTFASAEQAAFGTNVGPGNVVALKRVLRRH